MLRVLARNQTPVSISAKIQSFVNRITLLFLVLSLCACEGGQETAQDIADIIDRSEAYLHQGQYRAAIIEARNAIKADTESIEGFIALARIYNELNQAFATINLLAQLNLGNEPRASLLLSEAYLLKGKINSAKKLLENLPASLDSDQKTDFHLQLAKIAVKHKDFEAAQTQVSQVLADHPKNDHPGYTEAKILLAKIAILNNKPEKALTILDEILASKQNADALLLQAMIAYQKKELEKSEELLTEALILIPETDILTPQRSSVLRQLMHVITLQGRSAEALIYAKVITKAAPERKEIEEKLERAISLYQQGKLEESKTTLTELHSSVANKEITGQFLGMINFRQGNVEAAEQLLSEYVDPEIASNKTLQLLAASQLKLNKPKDLIALIEADKNRFQKDSRLQALYGIALIQQDQQQAGIAALNNSLTLTPKQKVAPLVLAGFYASQNNHEKALSIIKDATNLLPDSKKLQSAMVALLVQSKQQDKAYDFVKTSLKRTPNSISLNLLAGQLKLQAREVKAAQSYLNKILSLDNSHLKALEGLGRIALQQKDQPVANKIFTKMVASNPQNPMGYQGILATSYLTNDLASGIKTIEQMMTNNENQAIPTAVLAQYYLSKKDYKLAENYANDSFKQANDSQFVTNTYRRTMATIAQQSLANKQFDNARIHTIKALEITPGSQKLLLLLAKIEVESGQAREAHKIAQRLISDNPDSNIGHIINGDIHRKQAEMKDAIASYQNAWDIKATDAAGSRLYRLLERQHDANANSFLKDWLDKKSNSIAALTFMAMSKQKLKDNGAAINLYEKLVELGASNAVILNNLAWLYFEISDKKAIDTAEQAYQLAQNNPSVLDTYGWILVNNGQAEKGIEILETATKLDPETKEIAEHLEQAKQMR